MTPAALALFLGLLGGPALAQFGEPEGAATGRHGQSDAVLPDQTQPAADRLINEELGLRRNLNLPDAPPPEGREPPPPVESDPGPDPFLNEGGVRPQRRP